jgi:hypothetical protein
MPAGWQSRKQARASSKEDAEQNNNQDHEGELSFTYQALIFFNALAQSARASTRSRIF